MRFKRPSLAEIAERNRARARDEDLLASGWTPTPADLADAPFIDRYEETTYPGSDKPSLKGFVTGHPRLGTTYAWTSPLIARGDGWVRTEGRFYRLGSPAPAPEPEPPAPEPKPYTPPTDEEIDALLDGLPDYGLDPR
ncbi:MULTISPECIES: DUF6634 family protein [unclassified Methylobacterium]|uniref:DUF6634 family protein n=1 Tax=unclassified Methylobacterium TaxID=2615210 RepID=UPI00068B63CC|nr:MULTISPECIES: DUF6634 family protein [unclassified Methylobacterium]SFU50471.1 hypothetical protein SAMN02799643_00955 [Methylobacterium sp. UNCCL125]